MSLSEKVDQLRRAQQMEREVQDLKLSLAADIAAMIGMQPSTVVAIRPTGAALN